jgi:hypothetical protein
MVTVVISGAAKAVNVNENKNKQKRLNILFSSSNDHYNNSDTSLAWQSKIPNPLA